MIHALVTALAQLAVWVATGNPVAGGALLVAFWTGNEFAQAEYRAIGSGRRSDVPWHAGLQPRNWTGKGWLDVLLPLAVCVALGLSL